MTNDRSPLPAGGDVTGDPTQVSSARRARRAEHRRKAAIEWVVAIVVAVTVAFVIKTWVAQTFVIPSGSMENTLLIGDRVLVSKLSYRFGEVERGDVIVFDNPECENTPAGSCQYAQLIKRVVAVGGDEVAARNGQLIVNGEIQPEPFLKPGSTTNMPGACSVYDEDEVLTVPAGRLLVLGDNRNLSKDGRCFGPISTGAVVGRAFVRVWPLTRLGRL